MKISNKNFDTITTIFTSLKFSMIPYNVTLYFQDNEFNRVGRGIHVNLKDLPIDILLGQRNYVLKIRVNGHNYFLESHNLDCDPSISDFYDILLDSLYKMEETYVNESRKKRLDKILDDKQPLTLE